MKVKGFLFLVLAVAFFSLQPMGNTIDAKTKNSNIDVEVSTDKQTYSAGEEISYSVIVTNNSAFEARDVKVTSNLPEGFSLVDADSSITEPDKADGNVTWKIEKMDPSEQVNLTFEAKVKKDNNDDEPKDKQDNDADDETVAGTTDDNSGETVSAPQTGDSTNFTGYIIMILVSLAVLVLAIWAFKLKRFRKIATFLVALALILPSLSVANAAEKTETIEVTHKITVDGTDYKLVTSVEAVVTFYENPQDYDKDGLLNDFEDLYEQLDKFSSDSDGDGQADGEEDFDQDGLTNSEEQKNGTDPFKEDTDGDGLLDGDEVHQHGTDPTMKDTDEDEIDDNIEINSTLALGTDPTNPDTDGNGILDGDEVFEVTVDSEQELGESAVIAGTSMKVKGKKAHTVKVENVEGSNANIYPDIPGYLGAPYNFEGDFEGKATMTFTYDTGLDDGTGSFEPSIFYFNEKTGILEKVDNVVVDKSAGSVTATVDHFSKYLLLNETKWEAMWSQEFIRPRKDDDTTVEYVDIVFAVDSSGSMTGNDPDDLRKDAVKNFVDSLLSQDQAALVDWDSSANVVVNLTTDHGALEVAIDSIDSSSGTDLNDGLQASFNELLGDNGKNSEKYVIFLTDGIGSYNKDVLDPAIDNGIKVFTIGLSDSVDEAVLQEIADLTGGEYLFASTADELLEKYNEAANETTGPEYKDTDGDGISDYEEENGYFLVNAGMITTDPTVADTDGDGIKDGGELGELAPKSVYIGNGEFADAYHWNSRPDKTDTDGDGINDNEDDNPLVK
ncbi:VWA domain-containing protein [Virgibacillus litoralis]|uniref:Repeat protein (TIGR01451 family) n=1 Tax=Virgibacillus litoralis TaxID=578221 RepID=A0ABS4HBP9_9BACI|nr:VWA domain-containing protein [Virgibacillus litoralis]MBP1948321.1 putative repeat protein (TIGR01451 family) [Virgibacillus litoralis]